MKNKMDLEQDFDWPEDGMRKALNLIQGLSEKSHIIVDVGAHQGETADIARRFLSGMNIEYVAIEANPDTFELLQQNVEKYRSASMNVRAIHAAAGPKNGVISFSATKASAVAGVLAPVQGLSERVPSGDHEILARVEVPMIAVDTLFSKGQSLSLLKVDAEGFDLEVLKGAHSLLQSQSIDVVLAEVFFVAYRQGQAYFWDIASYLESFGYMFVNLFDTRETSQGRLYTGNGLWVSPRVGSILSYL